MPGPETIVAQYANQATISASAEHPLWANGTGEVYSVVSASYMQADVTVASTSYFTIGIHRGTTAGVHTDVVATATLSATALVAYVPVDLTLTTNTAVEDGEFLTAVLTEVGGVNTTLSQYGQLTAHLVKGTGANQ